MVMVTLWPAERFLSVRQNLIYILVVLTDGRESANKNLDITPYCNIPNLSSQRGTSNSPTRRASQPYEACLMSLLGTPSWAARSGGGWVLWSNGLIGANGVNGSHGHYNYSLLINIFSLFHFLFVPLRPQC